MSKTKQLFGTDGIRGVAGEYPLDARTVYAFGLALWHHGECSEALEVFQTAARLEGTRIQFG